MTNQNSAVFTRAAEILEDGDWRRDTEESCGDGVCLWTAVQDAFEEQNDGKMVAGNSLAMLKAPVFRAIREVDPDWDLPTGWLSDVFRWNDTLATDKAQAVSVLRKAAELS